MTKIGILLKQVNIPSMYCKKLTYFKSAQPQENVQNESVHEISNNVVCAASKASDLPTHTRSVIRAFAIRLSILWMLSYWLNTI